MANMEDQMRRAITWADLDIDFPGFVRAPAVTPNVQQAIGQLIPILN